MHVQRDGTTCRRGERTQPIQFRGVGRLFRKWNYRALLWTLPPQISIFLALQQDFSEEGVEFKFDWPPESLNVNHENACFNLTLGATYEDCTVSSRRLEKLLEALNVLEKCKRAVEIYVALV